MSETIASQDGGRVNLIDALYGMRNSAGEAADRLHEAIADAQALLARLDQFTEDCEALAQLGAASDLWPNYTANVPDGAGLTREDPR